VIGQTLSHYRITAALGAGGMGEVYRATDTNLGRDVAVKVLPSEVAQDPERLGRFKREAHLLASLNHPNIAAIYGLEEADGKPFLALELVEGEDLKKRLERGAIPVDDALEIAEQVAEALEEAHHHGIVHRDLKPANVKVSPDGKVKVLDFGLAKAWAGDAGEGGSSASISESPTLAHSGTAAGIILGTAAYMSPEQARGKVVDRRADVWSFGVLLWEMLTGHALFAGDTVTDVIAAVVTKEPDLDALPGRTPRAVRRLITRCLRKDPRTRLPDIGAARLELQDAIAGTADEAGAEPDGGAVAATELRRSARRRWAWAALGFVAGGLASLFGVLSLTRAPQAYPVHLAFEPPDGGSIGDFDVPAVSPDGRRVAFPGASSDGTFLVWLRSLDSPVARPLAGTEGGFEPFWSPDGESLAFFTQGELRRISLASGTVQRICTLPAAGAAGGTWGTSDVILMSLGFPGFRVYSVPASGGEARALTTHDESRGETAHSWPQFLPDGRRFLFLIASPRHDAVGVHVASLEAPDERRRLLPAFVRAWHASDRLLFVQDGTLLAQPFDSGRAELTAEPVAIASSVASFSQVPGWAWFSASEAGVLAYQEGDASGAFQLTWLDRAGAPLGTLGEPALFDQLTLSPDGRHVAVGIPDGGQNDIWTIDVARGVATRVTFDPADDSDPVWSPDSRELVFSSGRASPRPLYRKDLRGSEPEALLPPDGSSDDAFPESWSPKGLFYMTVSGGNTGGAFWMLPPDGDGEPEQLMAKTEYRIDEPQLSPDGRWLAYISEESGRWEVYIDPFRRDGERVRVSPEGGGQPKWRSDGKELFYLSPAGQLMAVEVREGPSGLEVGLPTALFSAGRFLANEDHYAVSGDGQRFLVKAPLQQGSARSIHVVTNWPSLLE